MSRKVGLIGCGTIGSELALAIDNGMVPKAELVVLYDKVENVATELQSKLRNTTTKTFSNFSKLISSTAFTNADIVIEAASQEAVRKFAKTILQLGKDLIIMSVGALGER
ncbi:MAG TPA: Gfo/Idh/MocA family oxidoreductase, partial [Nitrososphaeraceae archaeon]|nr:Gfo/Idh/MocA family oxidoreductase [Nitrososphaeraceae archaeon]